MTQRHGVLLYGPPASGKDTVDQALRSLSSQFLHYERLKVGPVRREGYQILTETNLDELRSAGLIIWENRAYGSTYAIDRESLEAALNSGNVIVHLGQVAGVEAVRTAFATDEWLVVDLWCERSTAVERLAARSRSELRERLAVWDVTPRFDTADVSLNTGRIEPSTVARMIMLAIGSDK